MAAGDHLIVERKRWFGSYYHHGIDVGNDRVIHLTGTRKKDAAVIETSLEEFLKGGVKETWHYSTFVNLLLAYRDDMRDEYGRPDPILPFLTEERIQEIRAHIEDPERAVTEARKHLGKKGYDLFSNNCEHFAVFCKTGLAVSVQLVEYAKLSRHIHNRAETHGFPRWPSR